MFLQPILIYHIGMGVALSVNKQTVKDTVTSSAVQTCEGEPTASNVLIFKDDTISCSVQIDQTATVDATCYINAVVSNTASTIAGLTAEQKGGLGYSVESTQNDIQTDIETQMNQSCGQADASNIVDIENTKITGCPFVSVQNASSKSQCQLKFLNSQLDKVDATIESTNDGGSLFGDIFGDGLGSLLGVVFVIVVVIILIVVGVMVFKKVKGSNKQEATMVDSTNPLAATAAMAGGECISESCDTARIVLIVLAVIAFFNLLSWFAYTISKDSGSVVYPKESGFVCEERANGSVACYETDIYGLPFLANY